MAYSKWFKVGLLMIIFWLLPGQSVWAVGVGVKPKEINLQIQTGKEVITEFLVINVSQEPALYQVYPDGLQKQIQLEPIDFQLEPDGSQIVKAKVIAKTPGRFSTNISVVARPLGAGGLTAASGVKVPITIIASGLPWWWLVLGGVIIFCLIGFFVVILRKRKITNNLKSNI